MNSMQVEQDAGRERGRNRSRVVHMELDGGGGKREKTLIQR